jgi:hypothetical protein
MDDVMGLCISLFVVGSWFVTDRACVCRGLNERGKQPLSDCNSNSSRRRPPFLAHCCCCCCCSVEEEVKAI